MKFALGEKMNMTQTFDDEGLVHPVTRVRLYPLKVTRLLEGEKDKYSAIQVGYGEQKKERLSKPELGNMKGDVFRGLKEFRTDEAETTLKVGDTINPTEIFAVGDVVYVSSRSKGKGFQGVVKRWGFKGAQKTHGQKHTLRRGGSIGGGLPTRVPKGKKMPGRMGGRRKTVKGTKIISIDKKEGVMLLSGSVPGSRGTLVEIQTV